MHTEGHGFFSFNFSDLFEGGVYKFRSQASKGGAMFEGKHSGLTKQIIGAFFKVYNTLGYGFLEKVYENALVLELGKAGLKAEQQLPILIYYDAQAVGEYFADIVVDETVIIELKAVRQILQEHEAQLLNYLKATRFEVGLLLNFGPKAEYKRKVYDNTNKGTLEWTKQP